MTSQSVATNENNDDQTTPESAIPANGWSKGRISVWIAAAFALLFIATLLLVAPQIQQRLDRQTKNRLQQAGINTATLQFDWEYRDLTVSGYLPDGLSLARLAMILRGTTEQPSALFAKGIRNLRLNLDAGLPVNSSSAVEDLLVEVSSDGSDITLSGVVQNDVQRNILVQASLASGADNVFDNLDVQSIGDTVTVNQRVNALSNMLQQLGPMQTRRAEIQMNEDQLYYRVVAQDKDSARAIESAAAVEIAGFNIKGGVELPSNKKLDLVIVTDGERITASGLIYSEAHRKRLLFAATEAVGSQNVVDNLTVAEVTSDSPELMDQVDSVAAVISRFAPGITGSVTLRGAQLAIDVETGSESVREYVAASTARAERAGLQITDNIRVLKPADSAQALQTRLDQLINEVRETVVFASGESVLSDDAMKTLDKIAGQINTYKGLVIEIEGHTDDVGRSSINEKLSQNRANAVRDYLATAVAASNQLIPVGYGHRRPIESNDTADGRQANRRVHFTVLKQTESASTSASARG